MMQAELLFGEDTTVGDFVQSRIPEAMEVKEYSAIGVTVGGRLIAGVIYYDYRERYNTIEIGMAADSPQWAKPEIIFGLLSYPFRQLECYKVRAVVKADNKRAIATFKHVGFIQEGILGHEFGPKQHAVIMRMTLPDFNRIYGGIRDEAAS